MKLPRFLAGFRRANPARALALIGVKKRRAARMDQHTLILTTAHQMRERMGLPAWPLKGNNHG